MALTKVTSGGISDIAAAVEGASDSNTFTDAESTKLNAIEANATVDQTNAEIKAAVEAATDSNTFTDADHSKLDGVAASSNNYVHPNHSGDVVSAADGAMTIQTDAVDIAMLSATGTPGSTTFLRGDNAWATAGSTSASDLTSGTLPDARFPSTLPAISGANLTGLTSSLSGLTDTTVSSSDPASNTNPSATGHLWVNKTSGESYVCTDATTNANVWTNIGGGSGNVPLTYSADFLVIAGGGGGSRGTGYAGNGGGAGGYRNSYNNETSGGGGSSESAATLSKDVQYTITVGAGGSEGAGPTSGGDSSVSGTGLTTITSVGGGKGAYNGGSGTSGGSGGAVSSGSAGAGTANQGYAGGVGTNGGWSGGGGGGASAVGGGGNGQAGNQVAVGGVGGAGRASSITGSSVTRAGGGGGGSGQETNNAAGGAGGGGKGNGPDATVNTGSGGGGGAESDSTPNGSNGGSGVVILRVPAANYSGTTTGSPSVSNDGTDKVLVFNSSGSYTA